MNDWRQYTVQELIDLGWLEEPLDGNHGSIHPKTSDYVSTGVPFIMATDLRSGTVDYKNCAFITETQAAGLRKGFSHPGDVLLTHKATIGRTAIVPDTYKTIILTPQVTYYRVKKNIDNRYLKYYFDTPAFQITLSNWAGSGSTRAYLGITAQKKLPVILPEYAIQKRVASILGILDDKIRNNNEINENLQQQAFAFFEQLLSQSKGDFCMLCDIAELNPKRQLVKGVVARCIDMAQLSTSGAFPSGWEMKPYNGGMRFTNGDTIIARITPCLENGKTAFIDFLGDSEVAFGSTEYIVLASKGSYPAEFFYCLARYPAFVDYAVKNMNGSSGRQRVSADTLGKYLLPRISEEEMVIFRNTVTAMFKVMQNNSMENMRLSALRDTLLPRLMSGELDVSSLDI